MVSQIITFITFMVGNLLHLWSMFTTFVMGITFVLGNSIVCRDIWHKYHEWYFEIVIRCLIWNNFETDLEWYLCQISRTNHAIICFYYFLQMVCNFHM